VIAVLKLGGLDGPIQRIGNAYASQIEESTKKTDRSADRIEDATRHLMGVIERVGRIDATVQSYIRAMQDAVDRLARIEVSISDQSRRLSDVERRLTGVERRSYIPRRVPTQVDPK
jgi:chromosome segregation ATPase